MSESTPDGGPEDGTGISDEQLPDDLRPGEDNPLAEGLAPGESAGDLLSEGKGAAESEDSATTDDGGSDTSQER